MFRILSDISSDVLLVALLMKFMYETYSSKLLPLSLLVIPVMILPFLLGLGGRPGNRVLRLGVSIAGIIMYVKILTYTAQGSYGPYIFMTGMGLFLYMMGRVSHRMLRSLVIAGIFVSAIITYLLVSS